MAIAKQQNVSRCWQADRVLVSTSNWTIIIGNASDASDSFPTRIAQKRTTENIIVLCFSPFEFRFCILDFFTTIGDIIILLAWIIFSHLAIINNNGNMKPNRTTVISQLLTPLRLCIDNPYRLSFGLARQEKRKRHLAKNSTTTTVSCIWMFLLSKKEIILLFAVVEITLFCVWFTVDDETH